MTDEDVCNSGECQIIRKTGDNKHTKHLNEQKSELIPQEVIDKDEPFRNHHVVMGLFISLIVLGGLLTAVASTMNLPIIVITLSIMSVILIALAVAVLNKGESMKTRDKIDRIEEKVDEILERLRESQNN